MYATHVQVEINFVSHHMISPKLIVLSVRLIQVDLDYRFGILFVLYMSFFLILGLQTDFLYVLYHLNLRLEGECDKMITKNVTPPLNCQGKKILYKY